MTLYKVTCHFDDGSKSEFDGLSHQDLIVLVSTFDNLHSMVDCHITAEAETAPWRVGDRVRHWAHQYTTEATGTVVEVQGPVRYAGGARGWELLVQKDKGYGPDDANRPSWWPGDLTFLVSRG